MPENGTSNGERLDTIIELLRELVSRNRQQPQRLMRLKSAARYLCQSDWQVRRLIRDGELPVIRTNNKAPFLLDKFDLDSWIEKSKMGGQG